MAEEILADQIAARLRRKILRGQILPGHPIKERDTASELGISRTPMREAIRILAKEGLVNLRPARSPIVAQLDRQSAIDQSEVLLGLEMMSAEIACRNATAKDFKKIEKILKNMAVNFNETDPLEMFELDMLFHIAIAEASHNQALVATHRAYTQRLWHARYLSAVRRRNRERVVSEHTQILAALHSRDPQNARAAIRSHLWHMGDDIRIVLDAESTNPEKD